MHLVENIVLKGSSDPVFVIIFEMQVDYFTWPVNVFRLVKGAGSGRFGFPVHADHVTCPRTDVIDHNGPVALLVPFHRNDSVPARKKSQFDAFSERRPGPKPGPAISQVNRPYVRQKFHRVFSSSGSFF